MSIFKEIFCCLCCCCCPPQKRFKHRDRTTEKQLTVRFLHSITNTPTFPPNKPKSSPKQFKLEECEEFYKIPTNEFKTLDEVFMKRKFEIHWGQVIGKGGYGVVYKATHTKGKEHTIACKRIRIPNVLTKKDNKVRQKTIKDAISELTALQKLQHPYIVKLIDYFIVDYPDPEDLSVRQTAVFILMQFAEKGSLKDRLTQVDQLTEHDCRGVFAQMLSAVHFMHDQRIAHRDLKLANVLLDVADDVLIADFGFSKVYAIENNDKYEAKTYCGTRLYMAPEILRKQIDPKARYDPFAVDIWAMGVMLFQLFNKKHPFDVKDIPKALKMMGQRQYKFGGNRDKPSKDLKKIIYKMLDPNPLTRPKIQELSKHKWICDKFIETEKKVKESLQTNPKVTPN